MATIGQFNSRLALLLGFHCVLLCLYYIPSCDGFVTDMLRRLTGYNCVQIVDGKVPPYYTCLGCVIEEAMGCIDDMRQNVSGNVGTGCNMAVLTESYNSACCPVFQSSLRQGNRVDMVSCFQKFRINWFVTGCWSDVCGFCISDGFTMYCCGGLC